MALVKGPFDIKWGANVLKDVESIDLSFNNESNEYTTIQGNRYTIRGAISASAELTFLGSDTESLAAILPQFVKTAGEEMSSGETVATDGVALDVIAANCTQTLPEPLDLDIISCENPAEVLRIKATETSISGFDLPDNMLRTITVTFTGAVPQGIAAVQMFKQGALIDNNPSS